MLEEQPEGMIYFHTTLPSLHLHNLQGRQMKYGSFIRLELPYCMKTEHELMARQLAVPQRSEAELSPPG